MDEEEEGAVSFVTRLLAVWDGMLDWAMSEFAHAEGKEAMLTFPPDAQAPFLQAVGETCGLLRALGAKSSEEGH